MEPKPSFHRWMQVSRQLFGDGSIVRGVQYFCPFNWTVPSARNANFAQVGRESNEVANYMRNNVKVGLTGIRRASRLLVERDEFRLFFSRSLSFHSLSSLKINYSIGGICKKERKKENSHSPFIIPSSFADDSSPSELYRRAKCFCTPNVYILRDYENEYKVVD